VPALGADWYVGNCHKWLFAPRSCAFLWCRDDSKRDLHPLAIRTITGKDSRRNRLDRNAGFLSLARGRRRLRFFDRLGAARVRAYNHDLVVTAASRIAAAWQRPSMRRPQCTAR